MIAALQGSRPLGDRSHRYRFERVGGNTAWVEPWVKDHAVRSATSGLSWLTEMTVSSSSSSRSIVSLCWPWNALKPN